MRIRNPRPAALLAALVVLANLAACSADVGDAGGPPAQTVNVAVEPKEAELAPGQTLRFASAVTGTADTSVVWSVVGSGGGTVAPDGLYTAPAGAGTYQVRATSVADVARYAEATVTVRTPPSGSVAISPRATSVLAGGTVSFTAVVTGIPDPAVTWRVQETSGCGSVDASGRYTAPATARTCHVVATSVGDPTRSDTATVTVSAPVIVSITPSTATVDACGTATFHAAVSGTSDQSVTWRVLETVDAGTITSAGVYTAPNVAGTYHVVATSAVSGSATAQATITVRDRVLSVTVDPPSVTLASGATQQFTATVTTTCGVFQATRTITAP